LHKFSPWLTLMTLKSSLRQPFVRWIIHAAHDVTLASPFLPADGSTHDNPLAARTPSTRC
jgi:hypothetical protein